MSSTPASSSAHTATHNYLYRTPSGHRSTQPDSNTGSSTGGSGSSSCGGSSGSSSGSGGSGSSGSSSGSSGSSSGSSGSSGGGVGVSVSPSLSSLSSIRAQLQQLNQRIKHDTGSTTAALPQPLTLSLSLSPIPSFTPSTPHSSQLSHDSFSSPAAYINTTLPASDQSTDDSLCQSTISPNRSRRHQSIHSPHTSLSSKPPSSSSSSSRHSHSHSHSHHDIYHLAGPSSATATLSALSSSPPTPTPGSGCPSTTSADRWRREAKEAQRASHILKANCLQLQLQLMEERKRRETREAEEERARLERARAMDDMGRDIEAMRRQMNEGRQQLEGELRAEYEEIVAAIMKEREEVEEAAHHSRLTHEEETSRLQQQIGQVGGQVRESEVRARQCEVRASEAEERVRQLDRQLQHTSDSEQHISRAHHSELMQRVVSTLAPLIPTLAQQHQHRMADMEQRLVRINTTLQLATSKLHARQQLVDRLTAQHNDDTSLLQRNMARITQLTSHHQLHVQRLTAEHDAYCAMLRAQLEEERAKAERAGRAVDEEKAGRRADEERWERREAELRRDREELSAYYHTELDKLICEIEQLENDKEEMSANISTLHQQLDNSHNQPDTHTAHSTLNTSTTNQQQQDESSVEWQQRASDMADRLAVMQDEVVGMRDEITLNRQREREMRRAVAAIRRESSDRDEEKDRQLDELRSLLQQMRRQYEAAAALRQDIKEEDGGHSSGRRMKGGKLDESKESGACDESLNDSSLSAASDDSSGDIGSNKENVAPNWPTLHRVMDENEAMKREVARERQKFSQLLKVRQFVQQHCEQSKQHTVAVSGVGE